MEIHGESSDACAFGIELCHHLLLGIFEKYLLDHIHNGNKYYLFFRQLPKRSLMKEKVQKRKNIKKLRITLNFIVNIPGNDIHLKIMQFSSQLQSFGKTMHPYNSYGLDCYHTKSIGGTLIFCSRSFKNVQIVSEEKKIIMFCYSWIILVANHYQMTKSTNLPLKEAFVDSNIKICLCFYFLLTSPLSANH